MPGIGFVLKSLFEKKYEVNPFVSRQTPDVLEVLTEVDEKSRRYPEMIQYFIVSLTHRLRARGSLSRHSLTTTTTICLSLYCRTTCRDS